MAQLSTHEVIRNWCNAIFHPLKYPWDKSKTQKEESLQGKRRAKASDITKCSTSGPSDTSMTTRSACTGSLLELQVLSHWLKQPWEKIMKNKTKQRKNLCPENSQTVLNRKQDSQWVTLLAWGLFKIEMCRGHKQIYTILHVSSGDWDLLEI